MIMVKIKQSHNRPDVAQRVPGSLVSQISMTFSTWRWWDCQPHIPAAFTLRKCSWYSFSLGAESTPWPWYGQKDYVTEKSSDTTGNRSRDRPTSSTAPQPLHHPRPQLLNTIVYKIRYKRCIQQQTWCLWTQPCAYVDIAVEFDDDCILLNARWL
jgi:hypothetical protein